MLARYIRTKRQALEQTKCVAQAAGGMTGDQPKCIGLNQDPLERRDGLQPANDVVEADAPEVEPLAAGDDRRKEFFRVGRGEDKASMGWRLFQRLEEGICRGAGDLVRFVDDIDLGAKLRGCVPDALPKIPNVVDAAVAGGVDLDDVRRGAGIDGHAVLACVAGAQAGVVLETIDRFGEHPSRRRLPGAARAAEKVGVSDSIEPNGVLQGADDVLLTD